MKANASKRKEMKAKGLSFPFFWFSEPWLFSELRAIQIKKLAPLLGSARNAQNACLVPSPLTSQCLGRAFRRQGKI
jgi:hypothetical protein